MAEVPELFVPGRIVHVYSSQGLYHAAFVERDSPFLSEIALTGNMIKDHAMQAYFDALCEVQDVRRAPEQPPPFFVIDEPKPTIVTGSHAASR